MKPSTKGIPVNVCEMSPGEAERTGALGFFKDRYGDVVKVYTIEGYSREICGGPHVEKTSDLGRFRIASEKSSSRGVRRIRGCLNDPLLSSLPPGTIQGSGRPHTAA